MSETVEGREMIEETGANSIKCGRCFSLIEVAFLFL